MVREDGSKPPPPDGLYYSWNPPSIIIFGRAVIWDQGFMVTASAGLSRAYKRQAMPSRGRNSAGRARRSAASWLKATARPPVGQASMQVRPFTQPAWSMRGRGQLLARRRMRAYLRPMASRTAPWGADTAACSALNPVAFARLPANGHGGADLELHAAAGPQPRHEGQDVVRAQRVGVQQLGDSHSSGQMAWCREARYDRSAACRF